jgi:hypothetical protein
MSHKPATAAAVTVAAIGGGYLLYQYAKKQDFGIPDPGSIAGGVVESIRETVSSSISKTTKEVFSFGDLPQDRALSSKQKKAIKARAEPGKTWSLSPDTTAQITTAPKSAGSWVESCLDTISTAPPAKKGPTRGVPTGELSEYTPKQQQKTVFASNHYKGPSLLGWFTSPAKTVTGTGLKQTGVYVPGYGIAQNVTLPKGNGSPSSKGAATSKRVSVGSSYGDESAVAKTAYRVGTGPGSIKKAKTKKLTVRRT